MSPTAAQLSAARDGVSFDISRDHYDRIERVNFSTLKWMRDSPAHYRHVLGEPFEDTDPKKCGRAIHIMTLEPERARSSIAIWDGGSRKGKDWEKFKSDNAGLELLTEKEHDRCSAVANAARADPIAAKYLNGGRGEVTMLWTFQALDGSSVTPAKGRLDFVKPTAIVDLKTTKNASPDGFGKEVWNYRYHSQAAWYQDGYAHATGKRLPYFIVAVENFAPYVTQVYRVPDQVLALGREEYSQWLDRLAQCRKTSTWPTYHDAELELTLPRWALGFEDGDDTDLSDELDDAGLAVDLITPAN